MGVETVNSENMQSIRANMATESERMNQMQMIERWGPDEKEWGGRMGTIIVASL